MASALATSGALPKLEKSPQLSKGLVKCVSNIETSKLSPAVTITGPETKEIIQEIRRGSSEIMFERKDSLKPVNTDDSITSATEEGFQEARRRSSAFLAGVESSLLPLIKQEISHGDGIDFLPLFIGCLTDDFTEQARKDLNETEDTKKSGLKQLKELIRDDKKISCPMDDTFLIQFLRARKFDAARALETLRNYLEYLVTSGYAFHNSTEIDEIIACYQNHVIGTLPQRDSNGCSIAFMRFNIWEPGTCPFEDLIKTVTASLVIGLEEPITQVAGLRVVLDFRDLGWKQLKAFSLRNFYNFINGARSCFPVKYKSVHILSDNRLFDVVLGMSCLFLTQENKEKLVRHGDDLNSLQDYIHPYILPEEYGGMAGPCDFSFWEDIVYKNQEKLAEISKYRYK